MTNSSYTWAFDRSSIIHARYTDGSRLSVSTVEDAIAYAVGEWTNAANQAGTRITIIPIQPPTNYGGANIHFNIPDTGKVFTWRESTFPHTVEAIDGQSFGGYVRRYQFWTLPDQSTNPTNPHSVPVPSSGSATYTYISAFGRIEPKLLMPVWAPDNDEN